MAGDRGVGSMVRIGCWSRDLKERKDSSGVRVSTGVDVKMKPSLKPWMMVGNSG